MANLLQFETSPYLLQHAQNPVEWHAWNDTTLAKARESDKILLISIGYSACHWCHVMEKECFEDKTVAALMNDHFICVKVDREERPDVDQLYMQASHLITGRGGWPLNAFALPDGSPFYAGMYFPKANWIDLLKQLTALWQNERETILNAADQIIHGIRASGRKASTTSESPLTGLAGNQNNPLPPISLQQFHILYSDYRHRIDFKYGGEKQAPKFPMPSMWEYILQYHALTDHEESLSALNVTLINMARGGIYDHAGGGFARYSTDERWHVPHFEKMLYDNAQLVTLYAHAYQLTGHTLYKDVINETLEFIERELTTPEGGCYAALDADSEGEEGRFYVWTENEIDQLLEVKAGLFKEVYNITTEGNWENRKNILHRRHTVKLHAEGYGMHHHELEQQLRDLRRKVREQRDKRVRPGLDDKQLCSWNAMMVKAYFVAGKALQSDGYLSTAIEKLEFILTTFRQPDGSLHRNFKAGRTTIEGLLDDYAFMISALTEGYQTVFDERYLREAENLMDYCLHHFADPENELFFYTHDRSTGLVTRMKELNDNVIPASNSEMAINLYTLGTLLDKPSYITRARTMVEQMKEDIESNIYYHGNWGRLALMLTDSPTEIAICGPEYKAWAQQLNKHYLPHVLLSASEAESELALLKHKYKEGVTQAFICKDKTCGAPIVSLDTLLGTVLG